MFRTLSNIAHKTSQTLKSRLKSLFNKTKNQQPSIDGPPASLTGFLSLPPEIRDQIYSELFAPAYSIERSPTSEPDMIITRHAAYSPLPSTQIAYRTSSFSQPLNHLSILLTSRLISTEALRILHQHSTFIFDVSYPIHPWLVYLSRQKTLQQMHNVEIYINHLLGDSEKIDEGLHCTMFARGILKTLGGHATKRKRCVVEILYSPMIGDEFIKQLTWPLSCLTGFQEVELRLVHTCTHQGDDVLRLRMVRLLEEHAKGLLEYMHDFISSELGPAVYGVDVHRVISLRYHPRSFQEMGEGEKRDLREREGLELEEEPVRDLRVGRGEVKRGLVPCWVLREDGGPMGHSLVTR